MEYLLKLIEIAAEEYAEAMRRDGIWRTNEPTLDTMNKRRALNDALGALREAVGA